ncbi:MAG: aminoacyl-tRNA hydrolase [Rickettsiales bacterium]|nr:MAG: aminoacyl-tRNA hydrolase [Rickettsiales bacterium]
MYLFVGLGNIGKKYESTRHNIGFMLIDKIIEKFNFVFDGKKFHSEIWQGKIADNKIVIIKPQTFMNDSGKAVLEIKNFYKIPIENVFVFHDDMDLPIAKIKYKIGGGNAGHNGLKSIDAMNGNQYHRIRIGIDKPEFKDDTINWVLGKFNNEELKELEKVSNKIIDNIDFLLKDPQLFLTKISIF